jgi:AraC-like DNA-binding protein
MHGSVTTLHESPSLIYCGTFRGDRGYLFPAHQHSSWELVYYRRGRVRAPIGDRFYDAVPGVLLATAPRTIHAERAATAYENIYVGIAADATQPWPELTVDDADESIGRLMRVLVREAAGHRPDAAELTRLLVSELDLLLRRNEDAPRSRSASEDVVGLVGAASRYIDERYAEPLRLGELARDLGSSPSSLRMHFRRERGCTPRDYLASVRLRHALEHLRDSSLTLDVVARLTGYDSASHLSRHVKAATGSTPGAFRRT